MKSHQVRLRGAGVKMLICKNFTSAQETRIWLNSRRSLLWWWGDPLKHVAVAARELIFAIKAN